MACIVRSSPSTQRATGRPLRRFDEVTFTPPNSGQLMEGYLTLKAVRRGDERREVRGIVSEEVQVVSAGQEQIVPFCNPVLTVGPARDVCKKLHRPFSLRWKMATTTACAVWDRPQRPTWTLPWRGPPCCGRSGGWKVPTLLYCAQHGLNDGHHSPCTKGNTFWQQNVDFLVCFHSVSLIQVESCLFHVLWPMAKYIEAFKVKGTSRSTDYLQSIWWFRWWFILSLRKLLLGRKQYILFSNMQHHCRTFVN